jgi:hypothetical protein
MAGRLKVTGEDASGRNVSFQDTATGQRFTRAQLVKAIEAGRYPDYHVRKVHGVKTPVSNPDRTRRNNLG